MESATYYISCKFAHGPSWLGNKDSCGRETTEWSSELYPNTLVTYFLAMNGCLYQPESFTPLSFLLGTLDLTALGGMLFLTFVVSGNFLCLLSIQVKEASQYFVPIQNFLFSFHLFLCFPFLFIYLFNPMLSPHRQSPIKHPSSRAGLSLSDGGTGVLRNVEVEIFQETTVASLRASWLFIQTTVLSSCPLLSFHAVEE